MSDWVPLTEWRRLPAVSGLYVIRHRESGKEYVGLSQNVRQRVGKHMLAANAGSLLHRAIGKHSAEAFDVFLRVFAPPEALPALETAAIRERGTMLPGGYNLTEGGEGVWGRRHTDEVRAKLRALRLGSTLSAATRAKISAAAERMWTPEMRAKVSAAGRGKSRSAETRARMSEANRSRPPEHWERVAAATRARTVTAETREKQAENARSRSPEHLAKIAAANRGKRASDATKALMSAARSKVVLAWPPGSTVPWEFESADAAAAWIGRTPASVSNYCNGKTRAPCGTVLCYLE